jgi:hypothetical protein
MIHAIDRFYRSGKPQRKQAGDSIIYGYGQKKNPATRAGLSWEESVRVKIT